MATVERPPVASDIAAMPMATVIDAPAPKEPEPQAAPPGAQPTAPAAPSSAPEPAQNPEAAQPMDVAPSEDAAPAAPTAEAEPAPVAPAATAEAPSVESPVVAAAPAAAPEAARAPAHAVPSHVPAPAPAAPAAAAGGDSDSEDDLPLAQRKLAGVDVTAAPASKPASKAVKEAAPEAKQQKPKQPRPAAPAAPASKRKLENGSAQPAKGSVKRSKAANGSAAKPPPKKRKKAVSDSEEEEEEESSASEDENDSADEGPLAQPRKRQATAPKRKAQRAPKPTRQRPEQESKEIKWTTLEHAGVLFPPEYSPLPDNIKVLYEGKPVDLTPEQEEVACFYANMIKTDYMQKEVFKKNFWEGFRKVLGKGHVIKDLEKCDFTGMYDWHAAEREKKKALPKEEKDRLKGEKQAAEGKFQTAKVDGKVEQVGNFRVEPPGLFRGRGEHPKMGRIKRRIYPKDITINIGKGVPTPEHPYPDQDWKEIRHDNTVTWLAFWHDPISPTSFKYVWLAANSGFKSESDQAKYEKARKLKSYITDIRAKYERDWLSQNERTAQIATAMYFIDVLALRAGHEKDAEEADTVGCCNLKAENVTALQDSELKKSTIQFDFLGKDSVQYIKEIEVARPVYKNIAKWTRKTISGKNKKPEEQLFDAIDAQDLNKTLKDCMEDLSAKVFRTYNASITLDRLLAEQEAEEAAARAEAETRSPKHPPEPPTVDKRKADYDRANKEVAILCNHQRAVGKAHDSQMEKMQTKLADHQAQLEELQADLKLARAGKDKKDKESGKTVKLNPDAVNKRIAKKREQILKAEIQAKVKEDLKTVALGTSKINYLDPRISVAWCKRNEVPMEKIFNKSLLSKFHWAMDVKPDFRF